MYPCTTLKIFFMRLDDPYESSIYLKLAIQLDYVILISSFMALRKYVFSSKKGRICKYLNICVLCIS